MIGQVGCHWCPAFDGESRPVHATGVQGKEQVVDNTLPIPTMLPNRVAIASTTFSTVPCFGKFRSPRATVGGNIEDSLRGVSFYLF